MQFRHEMAELLYVNSRQQELMPERLKKIPMYDYASMLEHPNLRKALLFSNRRLMTMYKHMPQYALHSLDTRQALMIHGTVYLHFSHRLNPAMPPLTAGNLYKKLKESHNISYNMISGFLKSMVRSGYLETTESPDGRSRAYRQTRFSERLSCIYAGVNLQALDVLDKAGRYEMSNQIPSLLISMLPHYAEATLDLMLENQLPESVANFATTNVGMLVCNEMTRLAHQEETPDGSVRAYIKLDDSSTLAERFKTRRINITRIFDMLRDSGDFGDYAGGQWVSTRILTDYRQWQAKKLVEMSRGFVAAYKTVVPAAAYL